MSNPSNLHCATSIIFPYGMVVHLEKISKVHFSKAALWVMQLQWIPKKGCWDAVCSSGCTYRQRHTEVPRCARLSLFSFSSTLCSCRCLLDSKPHTFYFLPINFSRIIAHVQQLKFGQISYRIGIYSSITFATGEERLKKIKQALRYQLDFYWSPLGWSVCNEEESFVD